MADWDVKKDNYGFTQQFTVNQADGTAKNLAGLTVTLKVWNGDGTLKFSGACTVTDAANGICTYDPIATDFDTVGDYKAELELSDTGYLEDTSTFTVSVYRTAP
jgi:hypothetical protein